MRTRSQSLSDSGEFKKPIPPKPPDPKSTKKRPLGTETHQSAKKKKENTPNFDQLSTSSQSSNIYSILSDDDVGEMTYVRNNKIIRTYTRQRKEPKQPPLVIHNLNIADIINLTKKCNITQDKYSLKITQFGTKLFAKSNNDYCAIKKALGDDKVNFFTYASEIDKVDKFVLYGLPQFTCSEIEDELAKLELKPSTVKQMNLKKQRHTNHHLYLVTFPRNSDVTLARLKQVRGLLNFVVNWKRFQPRNSTLTQCSNCQALGHGAKHCSMPTYCMKCSDSHSTSECPHSDPVTKKVPDNILRCILCGEKHTARFKDCVKRKEFQKIRETIRSKNQKKPPTSSTLNQMQYDRYFPVLPTYSNSFTPAQEPTPVYSSLLKKPLPVPANDDLFTPKECFQIFEELYSSLLSCKSKAEQVLVISRITCKYLESTTAPIVTPSTSMDIH